MEPPNSVGGLENRLRVSFAHFYPESQIPSPKNSTQFNVLIMKYLRKYLQRDDHFHHQNRANFINSFKLKIIINWKMEN
jgi:hypothetical protein